MIMICTHGKNDSSIRIMINIASLKVRISFKMKRALPPNLRLYPNYPYFIIPSYKSQFLPILQTL